MHIGDRRYVLILFYVIASRLLSLLVYFVINPNILSGVLIEMWIFRLCFGNKYPVKCGGYNLISIENLQVYQVDLGQLKLF